MLVQWLTSISSGPGRCFPFWQDVLACYVVNTSAEDDSGKKKCAPVLEDYYECLHHKKEVSLGRPNAPTSPHTLPRAVPHARLQGANISQHLRARAIQAAYARSQSSTTRDDAPSAKQIRNLGLIDKEEDTKKVLGQS